LVEEGDTRPLVIYNRTLYFRSIEVRSCEGNLYDETIFPDPTSPAIFEFLYPTSVARFISLDRQAENSHIDQESLEPNSDSSKDMMSVRGDSRKWTLTFR
jgi:hypothetical protein